MWLEGRLGMDREKAVKVILTFPVMLSMALDTMDWKIVWLQQRLSLSREQMMAVVVKYPNLLSYNIEDNLEPTLRWLEEDLGVDTAVAGKLVLRQPRLLSANLEDNLKNKVCARLRRRGWRCRFDCCDAPLIDMLLGGVCVRIGLSAERPAFLRPSQQRYGTAVCRTDNRRGCCERRQEEVYEP